MKKGTQVKFLGAQNRQPIEKTYVWAVANAENTLIYLIEHPQGVELTEENRKSFDGFNPDKLQIGKKYLVAYPGELINLSDNNEVKQTQTTVQPQTDEIITVKMPKVYFEQIKEFLESQKEQMQKNPLIKFQMKKEEFAEMIKFYDDLIFDTTFALNQTQTQNV